MTLGHVEEVIEGNPTLWLRLKVTGVGLWGLGSQKTLRELAVEVKKHRPKWFACWKWGKACGKTRTFLRGFYEVIVRFIPFNILHGFGWCSKCPSKQGLMDVWRRFLSGCPVPSPECPFSYTSKIITKYRLMVWELSATDDLFVHNFIHILPQYWLTWGCPQVFHEWNLLGLPSSIFHELLLRLGQEVYSL